jgi:hypothetical protein
MTTQSQVSETIAVILRYLEQHPKSEDTLEGISEWWMKKQRIEDSRIAVDQALQRLASERVISITQRNKVNYYKLN